MDTPSHASAAPFDARPALVATFFGPPAHVAAICARLAAAYALPAIGELPGQWMALDGRTWLRELPLPVNGDSAAAQFIANLDGPAAAAWEAARQQLADALPPTQLAALWGFSVLYQALLPEGAAPAEAAQLVCCARPPHANAATSVPALASAEIPGGRLWLTAVPLAADVPPAAVYVALGPLAGEDAVSHWLAGPDAPFLLPDLTAHKGYWQRRQPLQSFDPAQPQGPSLRDRYKELLEASQNASGAVLNAGNDPALAEPCLEALAKQFDRLTGAVPRLDDVRVQLEVQRFNLDAWTRGLPGQAIFDFHRSHLDAAIRDLVLLVQHGRDAQQAAATTIGVAQTRIDRCRADLEAEENRLAERRNWLLALIGAALAVPQFLDRDAAAALLACVDSAVNGCLRLDAAALPPYSTLTLVGVQIAVITATLLILAIALRRIFRGRAAD